MSGLLNGDFENWSGGTTFTLPLSDGTQLADNWFWNNGSHSASITDIVRTATAHTGSFAIDMEAFSNGGFVSNTDTYIYQDISNFLDYASSVTTFTCFVRNAGGTGLDELAIFIDDGITTTVS